MKGSLWYIFSLALILGLLLSVNLAESLASFKNGGIIKGDFFPENAGIIKGDLAMSAGIIKGGFATSGGIIKGDFATTAGIIKGDTAFFV